MCNLAIVLGVSNYNHARDLPACEKDVDNICELLEATEKYQILCIDQTLTKSQIIKQLEDFLQTNGENKQICELLFYFSGHGSQDKDGLHFILKDTELERVNATSLNNSELDDLIREYNPKLFVKIIDACQSGLSYIKSVDDESDILEKKNLIEFTSEKAFENCIFMSSSKRDEPSEATIECSLFTKAFISAVLDSTKADVIRYSDIQNYIIDVFNTKKYGQTPYFNLQSDGRAVFANVNQSLKNLATANTQNDVLVLETGNEIEGKLDGFLAAYRTEAEVQEIIEKIKNVLNQEKLPLEWLGKYYDISLEGSLKRDFQEDKGILNFLYERCETENLYVEIETERVQRENVLKIPFLSYETKPVHFSSLVHSLPSNISFLLSPKSEGLPQYEINLVFVYSDIGMYIFQGAIQLICKGWKEYVLGDKKKYTYKWLKYAKFDEEDWKTYVQKQLIDSAEFVEESLKNFLEGMS